MIYLAELYYWEDQYDFPFQHALIVTARVIAQWCDYFHAEILSPSSKNIHPLKQSGMLPCQAQERQDFVAELVQWLFENSIADRLFALFLDITPMSHSGTAAKFDHHDDTCCWALNLSESEFAILQDVWQVNNFPRDLFYPREAGLCIPYPGTGLRARVLRKLGVQKCYTPRQWRIEEGEQLSQ